MCCLHHDCNSDDGASVPSHRNASRMFACSFMCLLVSETRELTKRSRWSISTSMKYATNGACTNIADKCFNVERTTDIRCPCKLLVSISDDYYEYH